MSLILDGSAGVTFPSGSGTQAAQSKVLQVVNATYATLTSSTSSSYADTGLTASITPLFTTSKILVLVDLNGCSKVVSANATLGLILVRGSTTITNITTGAGYNNSTSPNYIGSVSTSYLDSPATTSATTYKIQIASDNASSTVRINDYGPSAGGSVSTITIMEIAA
jgi:hypothetical protein